jgi:hypothetical protein
MKKIIALGVTLALAGGISTFLSSPSYAGSYCNDGTYSYSSGQGTCSWHKGVSKYPTYKAPSYNYPSYKAPSYKAPSYKAPSYKAPSYKAPSLNFNW